MENARASRLGEKEIRRTGEKKRNRVEREEEERNLLPTAHLANDTPSHNHCHQPSRCIVFLCLFRPSHRLRDGMNWEKGDPRVERRISSRSLVFWLRRKIHARASLAFGLGRDESATVKSWHNFLETFLLDYT